MHPIEAMAAGLANSSPAASALDSRLEWPAVLTRRLAPEATADASASTPPGLHRRAFLKLSGAAGLALGAFPLLVGPEAQAAAPAASGAAPAALKPFQQPSAFVRIAPNGEVTVTVNRLEFGQGISTALPLILAEELDADWSRVRAELGSNDPAYVDPAFGMHSTGGSSSIPHSYTQYRELGARARAMLVAAAAQHWGIEPAKLRTDKGQVIAPDGRRAGYGELAQAAMAQAVPTEVKLKDPKAFKLIGKPTVRLDAKAKAKGEQAFGMDVRLPGQLTAVIARPPVFGAQVRRFDDTAAKVMRGVKGVFKVPLARGAEGVAIVATGYWSAHQARQALQVEWDDSGVEKADSQALLKQFQALASQPGPEHFKADTSALATAAQRIQAEFHFPYLAHAAMEPLNCTVQFTDAGATLWVGTQQPGFEAMAAAKVLGLRPDQVQVKVQVTGGGFGRRAVPHNDFVVESCAVAKAAQSAGLQAPIQLIWSREDDMRSGYYRPMHLHRADIGLSADGKVLAWDHVIVGQSITAGTPFESWMVKNGIDGTITEGMREPYPFPMRLRVHHPKVNVPVLWWRSVGATHTAYVMETLVDEIARKAGLDPVAYRLAQFGAKHPRHTAALQLAVAKSGYGQRKLAAGRAWGVAVHESFNSVVAYVVQASVKGGQAQLHEVTAGVHCNLAINPRSIEAQVEGAALMGLSMCLPGAAITLKDGRVEQGNFGEFALPRITDMPRISVHIVPSADPPTGMGEPGLPPLAPAFANAVAQLTGKPQRQLPFQLS